MLAVPHLERDTICEIREIAEKLLLDGDAERSFPLLVRQVLDAARIKEFPSSLFEKAARSNQELACVLRGVKGLSSRRKRRIFVLPTLDQEDKLQAQLHEAGHLVLPWHAGQLDACLTPAGCALFEREADAFVDEMIFRGTHFDALASAMTPSFDAVRRLAHVYRTSVLRTACRLVRDSSGTLVLWHFDRATESLQRYWTSPNVRSGRVPSRLGELVREFGVPPSDRHITGADVLVLTQTMLPTLRRRSKVTNLSDRRSSGHAVAVRIAPAA